MYESVSSPYPPQVQRFHTALERIPGVWDVASGSTTLDGLAPEAMSDPEVAHLPLGALRRTRGGLPREAFIQFEFSLEPSTRGWRALEFLGWFIRDRARGGEPIQLRAFGLPPQVGDQVQLGKTLGFQIDLFFPEAPPLEAALQKVDALADGLEGAWKLYGPLLEGTP
jgi:hypothetical protein